MAISNTCNVVSMRLDENNYLIWSYVMHHHLRGHGLLKFVDGSHPCPPPFSVTTDGKHLANTSARALWTRDRFWIAFGPTPVAFLAHEGWRGLAARDEDFVQKILMSREIRCPRGIFIFSSRGTPQYMARESWKWTIVPSG
ncbi:hypothetical protein ACLB2K_076102 [Fragaria x ananassa]